VAAPGSGRPLAFDYPTRSGSGPSYRSGIHRRDHLFLTHPAFVMIGSLAPAVIAAVRRAALIPARPGGGSWIVIGRCSARGMYRDGGAGGSTGVLGVYQVE
jgi:hypothetical protein